MLRVGLTGGIGSGKSTVAGRLAEHGAVLIDSDRLAREVVEPGTEGLAEVVAAFGADLLTPDGSLDRSRMAARVFGDDDARARLNAIVHPRVRVRAVELMAGAPEGAIVVQDVPLLVENGMAPAFHLVIVVDAPVDTRVHRLVTQRDMAEDDVRARIAAQASDSDRRAAADVWLDNSGAPDEILAAVDALWADRLVRFASNLRLHRRSEYGPPWLHDPDPTWPAQAERLAARIRLAAGERALRVDHIGSTAVPGLPAKDIIDLQLMVATLADAEAIAGPLAEAGFVLQPHVDRDHPHGTGPESWAKRYHASADPGRVVHLNIRTPDSGGARFALLCRDWLRADEAARADYLAVKRELSERFATDDDGARYAEAKEPWFAAAYPRMTQWAQRSGWRPPEVTPPS
ncbi:MAG TPA: dephospho-CoA kinase [Actinophytocola sp.]|uniref:dephospho-CoA kinase n=1 Tax=Actinophytocola sp. TaxID=1872138 RepID=UPI002DBD36AB|nr:dephospho-CoA kinase [Actinophytocola sp.]HEU5475135.1 dephospho-CoA kinase [Actinophytocola sp.]